MACTWHQHAQHFY